MVITQKLVTSVLTKIKNESNNTGEFPRAWKEALVTPVLKKGDSTITVNKSTTTTTTTTTLGSKNQQDC